VAAPRAGWFAYDDSVTTPLVGITTSLRSSPGIDQALINTSYIQAVQQAGGVPVLLPPQLSAEARAELLSRIDGLVLTGGQDVDPALYHEPPHEKLGATSPLRDATELDAIRAGLGRQIPILAICRGLQILNVARGGSLVQDIPSQVEGALLHSVQEPRCGPAHVVELRAGSRLAEISGATSIQVNSRHHQSAERLGARLEAVGHAPDGVVEALELPGAPFVVAVQWHPEDMVGEFESARRLFSAFVKACRR
jgi:putative glutamine amidotransferase